MYSELKKEPALRIAEASEPLAFSNFSAYMSSIDWLLLLNPDDRVRRLNELFDSED
jgi:hypothetical protein